MSALSPIQIVELRQPRCALRFGVGACPATGTPKCYNTWGTCPTAATKAVFDATGRIRWRFVQNRPGLFAVGDFSVTDDPATNAIAVAQLRVSTTKAELNIGALLDGKSPFGVHATVSVSMPDFVWDDHVGDFYLGDRVSLPKRNFWAVWTARNAFYGGMEIVVYEGYEGEALSAMRQRLYVLDNVDGPDSSGNVTLHGISPLIEAEGQTSKFPPPMDVRLVSAITAGQTTVQVLTNDETNLSRELGIGGEKGVRIGDEIMFYAAYSVVTSGIYDLTGVTRGVLNTVAASAAADARVQRIGYFKDVATWRCGEYLLSDHTPVGAARISTSWTTEGEAYLEIFRSTVAIATPTPVANLMGEIVQQGMFYIWWGEYTQKIEMQAIRAPDGAVRQVSTASEILAGSAELRRQPESLLTRIFVYYAPIDPTKTDRANYLVIDGQIEATNEVPQAAGKAYTLEIDARWINTAVHAQFLIARILSRYRQVPRFLTFRVSAKDREIQIGEALDVDTSEIVDTEGRRKFERWQVISWTEITTGEVYLLDTQTFDLIGRFGAWMDASEPDFDVATDDEKAAGGWWADVDGLMPDGSDGYQWG
jgi:hypothetical protein